MQGRRVHRHLLAASMLLMTAADVRCQAPASPTSNQVETIEQSDTTRRTDNNPTRPIFFSLRPEFYKQNDEVSRGALIFRYDQAALRKRRFLPGQRGVVLRLEVPVSGVHVSGAESKVGLGDVYAQILVVPYFTTRFAFVVGTGLLAPTATDRTLGTGKLTLAPVTGPLWFLHGRGLIFVKIQALRSIAGDSSRPDANSLLIAPLVMHAIGERSWILVDSETKTDWQRNGRTGIKSGVQYGRTVTSNLSVWMKPEVWWGPNRDGQWNFKVGLVWYR